MVPSDRMFDKNGTLTVNRPDSEPKQLAVRCRIGQQYEARSDSPNFNGKVGVSIFFSLTGAALVTFRAVLSEDDSRVILTADGSGYEVTNVHDHGDFFKCAGVKCKKHGNAWV